MNVEITIDKHHAHTQQLALRMGAWVNAFPNNQYKWMLAQALNTCVHLQGEQPPRHFHAAINGYLIYNRDVFLVLHVQKKQLPHLLHFFSGMLKMEIIAELNRMIKINGNTAVTKALRRLNTGHIKLFREHPFSNYQLADMITGRPVSNPFDTPQFRKLYTMVHGNLFCSAIDYMGGKSPVIVEKKKTFNIEI